MPVDFARSHVEDAQALPDPWRASTVTLVMAAVSGVGIAVLIGVAAGWQAGIAAGLIISGMTVFAEMQAAFRLRFALAAFAEALPTEGRVAYQRWTSEQGIRWPALGVVVRGTVASFWVHSLVIESEVGSLVVAPRHARRAGEAWARRLRDGPPTVGLSFRWRTILRS